MAVDFGTNNNYIDTKERNKCLCICNEAASSAPLFIPNTTVQLQCFGMTHDKYIINVTLNVMVCLF